MTNAYANINGTNREIFGGKLYKWAKYTWSTDGVTQYYGITEQSDDQFNDVSDMLSNNTTISFFRSAYITTSLSNQQLFNRYDMTFSGLPYNFKITSGSESLNSSSGSILGKSFTGNYLEFDDINLYADFPFYNGKPTPMSSITKPYSASEYPCKVVRLAFDSTSSPSSLIICYHICHVDQSECIYRWRINPIEYIITDSPDTYSTWTRPNINISSTFLFTSKTYFPYNSTYRLVETFN